jgi:hypothetical protein
MKEFRIVQSGKGMKKELHLLGETVPSLMKGFSKITYCLKANKAFEIKEGQPTYRPENKRSKNLVRKKAENLILNDRRNRT